MPHSRFTRFLQNTIGLSKKYYILIFKFDKKFYLACNPDVREATINPLQHFMKYGFIEKRLYRMKDCDMKLVDDFESKKYHHLFNFDLRKMDSKSFNLSTILIPWTPGCFGRPFQIMKARISNSILKSSMIVDSNNILYCKKGIFATIFLLKL